MGFFSGLFKKLNPVAMLGGLFEKPKAPPPPAAPTVMPTPDDEALKAARKRKLAKDMGRSGRLSTILSDDSESMG